jgi:hypothetical protein
VTLRRTPQSFQVVMLFFAILVAAATPLTAFLMIPVVIWLGRGILQHRRAKRTALERFQREAAMARHARRCKAWGS